MTRDKFFNIVAQASLLSRRDVSGACRVHVQVARPLQRQWSSDAEEEAYLERAEKEDPNWIENWFPYAPAVEFVWLDDVFLTVFTMKAPPQDIFAFALERRVPRRTPKQYSELASKPEEFEDETEWSALREALYQDEPGTHWVIGEIIPDENEVLFEGAGDGLRIVVYGKGERVHAIKLLAS